MYKFKFHFTYVSSPADKEFDEVFVATSTAKGESRIVVAVRLRINIHAMELLGTRGAGVWCCCIGVDRNSCKSPKNHHQTHFVRSTQRQN